ncbi:hypothetical protein Amal_02884 [Acetobacter malorum]|uniref:Uncharacterized protein n=1 Tax=Acetobacter malorum TaxID=178901 RepID=A0A177G639_9PROT|nr:hypothetical protein [Acetobacter malorum]OAG75783.1 hypothetical protein Amal_02884 [Acetobacter malorum]
MSRTKNLGMTAPSALSASKKNQKRQAVLRRLGLLTVVCALSFLTAHLIMLDAQRLPFEDMRLKTDLGGMVIAALFPILVLVGFAGRRHGWGLILGLVACGSAVLAGVLPF